MKISCFSERFVRLEQLFSFIYTDGDTVDNMGIVGTVETAGMAGTVDMVDSNTVDNSRALSVEVHCLKNHLKNSR